MIAPPYIECPECGSAAVTRSSTRDRCGRCGHAAREFKRQPFDRNRFDSRPRVAGSRGTWIAPTCLDGDA